jgi:acetyltransferase-like isoleucine patch superfamily enzyme
MPIKIGAHNWIGNRSNIMKGTITPDYCIVASGSLCNKKIDAPSYSLIAGVPARLIKSNIYRVLDDEESLIRQKLLNKVY